MQKQKKKIAMAVGVVFLLTLIVWRSEKSDTTLIENGQLTRRENGEGEDEIEMLLTVDETEETEWVVIVPEQLLTKQEEGAYLEAAIREIEAEFAGENVSPEEVKDSVVIRSSYQDGKVIAEWKFSIPGVITDAGHIREELLTEASEAVGASVDLSCGDSRSIYEFYFVVYKREKGEKELFYEKLNQLISKSGEEKGVEMAENLAVEVLFVSEDGKVSMTEGMKVYFHLSKQ